MLSSFPKMPMKSNIWLLQSTVSSSFAGSLVEILTYSS